MNTLYVHPINCQETLTTRRRSKNDTANAAAICEAITRPHMLFAPLKEEHQQIILQKTGSSSSIT